MLFEIEPFISLFWERTDRGGKKNTGKESEEGTRDMWKIKKTCVTKASREDEKWKEEDKN